MKVKIAFVAALFLAACSSSYESEDGPITNETREKTVEVQETNVELEKLDGELDSLLITLE